MIEWCNTNQGFLSALLAIATLVVSLYAIFTSTRLQKKIHNRDVKLTLQQKVLEIYNAYGDCFRLMKSDDNILSAKIGLVVKSVEQIDKIFEHRSIIGRVLNEANLLIIDDKPLKKLLFELYTDFMSLSECYIDLTQKEKYLATEAFVKIDKAFPELELHDLRDIDKVLAHPQAIVMFAAICTTPETEKFYSDLSTYRDKFSYENFDKLFENYLIRSKL